MATDTTDESATTTNAVSIILSALPSTLVSSVESDVSSVTYELFGTATDSQTTASATSGSSSSVVSSSATSSAQPSTLSTTVGRPSESLSSSSATPSVSSNVGPSPHAYVAGVVTGIAAAAVIVALAVVFLMRRRAQGKPFFGRRNSGRSSAAGSQRVYPEEAWLYDPKVTPRDGPGGAPREEAEHPEDHSRTRLLPEPREGTAEVVSGPPSPSLHPARPSSPLLAPEPVGATRTESPQGRARSGSVSPTGRRSASSSPSGRRARGSFANSRTDLTRPMSAIYEEPYKMSIDAQQSLLAPPDRSTQRHST